MLFERDSVPTLPADFDGKSQTADLVLTPDGRFLYGTNRGHDTIAMFTRDTDNGALTPNGIEPSRGEMPQNLTNHVRRQAALRRQHDRQSRRGVSHRRELRQARTELRARDAGSGVRGVGVVLRR